MKSRAQDKSIRAQSFTPPPTGLVQRKCACGASLGLDDECDECRQKRLASPPPALQTKLPVSQPGDPYEQEADRMAEQVTHAAESSSPPQHSLSEAGPMIQRLPADEDIAPGQETGAPAETVETSAAPVAEAEPAPAEPTAEPATTAEAPTGGLIVEDDAGELMSGQMRKGAFLDELRAEACAVADAELAAVGRSTEGCPYIERWIGYYRTRDSGHVERAIRRYAPETVGATSAREYISLVSERIRQGVARWARTGEISGVPEELLSQVSGAGLLGGIGGAVSGLVSGIGSLFFKEREGGTRDAERTDPQAIRSHLGGGSLLDNGVRARMESAFGHNFSRVRVHTDGQAASLSSGLNARAFTIGNNVAFGASEYQPGTLVGDALIAHELAHVVQQANAASTDAPLQKGGGADNALEEDADQSAVGEVVSMWNGTKGGLASIAQNAMPRLKSGLRLSRCKDGSTPAPTGAVSKKTVTVNISRLHGSTQAPDGDITFANTKVYNQANIGIQKGDDPPPLDEAKTKAILGLDPAGKGDLVLDVSPTAATVEEKELFKLNQESGVITAYYVKELSSGNTGESWIPSSGQGVGVEISNIEIDNTLAHEVGHVLLDSGHDAPDVTYLMWPTAAPNQTKLTPDQITKMRGSSYAK